MEKKAFQQTLPKKRISAGCLFFDEKGRLLVVNPTYKETWEIPGGVVERNESPREAIIREVSEELGVPVEKAKLIFIDSVRKSLDASLNGGERVGIFPPVGGG